MFDNDREGSSFRDDAYVFTDRYLEQIEGLPVFGPEPIGLIITSG